MDLLIMNSTWMLYNLCLAIIPVLLAQGMLQVQHSGLKGILIAVWLIFLPNSIYLIFDLLHIPEDVARTSGILQLVTVAMYIALALLGVWSYFLALYPVDKYISKHYRHIRIFFLSILHLAVGVALILGNILRVNSWDIVLRPLFVLSSLASIATSQTLLQLALLSGLASLLLYSGSRYIFLHIHSVAKKRK